MNKFIEQMLETGGMLDQSASKAESERHINDDEKLYKNHVVELKSSRIISKNTTVEEFLRNGKIVVTKGKRYFFSPFWLEEEEDGDRFIVHRLGNLPKDLVDAVGEERV